MTDNKLSHSEQLRELYGKSRKVDPLTVNGKRTEDYQEFCEESAYRYHFDMVKGALNNKEKEVRR